jgi:hypothetical protein
MDVAFSSSSLLDCLVRARMGHLFCGPGTVTMRFEMRYTRPNHPAAGKAGISHRLAIEARWSGLPEPSR